MKWISVKDKLPDYDIYVLWRYENGSIIHYSISLDCSEKEIELFLDGKDCVACLRGEITHWMPAPDPPE